MHILHRRLWHTIRSSPGQFLGMAIIIAVGISLYIGIATAFTNLNHGRDTFYQENNFADYYFYLVRAPESIIKQVDAVPGVIRATGRIQKDVAVLKDDGQRATVRLTSYPLPVDNIVNKIQLHDGRWFSENPAGGGIEVAINDAYLTANQISFGDSVNIVAEGKKYPVKVVGTAIGPEFIYTMKDSTNLMPDPETFGIMMIPQTQCQNIFNLPGQINQVIVQFAPGTDIDKSVREIKEILQPYGNLASFPRQDQLSHAALSTELDGLNSAANFLPLVFLFIAAGIQFVIIRRMIRTQRSQIGIMKAIGFNNQEIMVHYSSYALLISAIGSIAGIGFGIYMANVFLELYAMFFSLPQVIGEINYEVIFKSLVLGLGIGLLAGLTAARSVLGISPAESMRPAIPVRTTRSLIENWSWFWNRLDTLWRISIRSIKRNYVRFLLTATGILSTVALLILSMFTNDAVDYMMKQYFEQETSYDYMVYFNQPVQDYELLNISKLDGVKLTEGFFSIPVKIHYNGKSNDDMLMGIEPSAELKSPTNAKGEIVPVPEQGLIISRKSAEKLGLKVGDTVTVDTTLPMGENQVKDIKVVAVNYQLYGFESYLSLQQANKLLNEANLVSGALLKVKPEQAEFIEAELADMTEISSVLNRQKEKDNLLSLMDTMVYMVGTMIIFAAILGFVIIYNSVIMSFNERKRELVSLLTIGFTQREVMEILFKETIIQAVPGILLGLPAGRLLAEAYIQSIEYDMFYLPVVIYPSSYIIASAAALLFVLLGLWAASRGVKKLNIIELSKNND